MVDADVAVVGAGPAGSAAAVRLARAGREVVVLDRARFPRDKCCGDGLTTDALRRLDRLGLDPKTVASWQAVNDIVVRSPSGRVARLPFPRDEGTYAAVAQRRDLDAALVGLARDAGATVLDGCGLRAANIGADGRVVLEADDVDPVTARYAIGADGMWSPLRKALGKAEEAGYLGEWHAFRQYFGGVGPDAAQMWVWFEPDLLPGYAWSFPLPDGRANVGFGLPRRAGRPTGEMARIWAGLADRPALRTVLGAAEPLEPHRAWPIPARVTTSRLTAGGGRVLFAGDAARATDPMTGEGIAHTLETATLAADAILADAEDPARAGDRYRRDVARNLAPNHHLSTALSRVLRHRKGARGAVRVAGATDWTRRNFARWLFEDYPRAALFSPWRWERGLLSGPGAFR